MDKNEKAIYYERKLIAYEQMLSAYWEILTQAAEGSLTPSDYLLVLRGTVPSFLYFTVEVSKTTNTLESCYKKLTEAESSKELKPEIYRKAFRDANKAFGDLVVAMRKDMEGIRDDSSISETADR